MMYIIFDEHGEDICIQRQLFYLAFQQQMKAVQIIILTLQFLEMDIEYAQHQTSLPPLFRPIHCFHTSTLYHSQITLESIFRTSPEPQSSDMLLTLINSTLLLSDPSHSQFHFDLKFEVLRQNPADIFSRKMGVKFYDESQQHFSCYSDDVYVIEAWIVCLSKKLNQSGFHQMFKPLRKLGKGNFASVYEVQRLTDKSRFAVKAFSKQTLFKNKNGKESLINQINIMRELSSEGHPNVLKLEAVFESNNSIYMIIELLSGNQLFHKIQSCRGCFSNQEIKIFMRRLLGGLQKMHSQRIMHRDLKPENIMMRSDRTMDPVIVDFGLATQADIQQYLFFRCGTPGYVAPEIIALSQSEHIEPVCDIFSAGVIFHILLTKKPLFEGTKYQEVYRNNKLMNFNLKGPLYERVDPEALALLKAMLETDPSQRIKASQALEHSYLRDVFVGDEKVSSPRPTEVSQRNNLIKVSFG